MDEEDHLQTKIASLIEQFKKDAVQWHLGHYMARDDMQQEADQRSMAVIAELDRITDDKRAALVPLLQDSDPGIQALAGAYLLDTQPEIAIPVLKYLDDYCVTEASFTAWTQLMLYRDKHGPNSTD